MSILVEPNTKVLIQGITGGFGGTHAKLSLDYGTKVVAGVTPGKGGQTFESSVPIFDTVDEAVTETGATVSAIFVPPPFAGDAIMERMKRYRKAGLESGGIYSVENLVFKVLRRNDYLEKLNNIRTDSYDALMGVNQ